MTIFVDKLPGDTFRITQLSYLLIINENTVELHLRDELPITLLFASGKLSQFCTLVDGYYRMTESFTACLCSEIQPPSLILLKKRKIHGPFGESVMRRKLSKNLRSEGCFLVRQDQLRFRVYHVDILLDENHYVTHKICERAEGGLIFANDCNKKVYASWDDLLSERTLGGRPYQLPPRNRDKTGLQLCRGAITTGDFREEKDIQLMNLKKFKVELPPLRSTYRQQRVLRGTYEGLAAVCRILQSDDPATLQRFNRKATEICFWDCPDIVPIVGFAVSPQACLASEFMPLGSLDAYLKNSTQDLTTGDLCNVALCLARAVRYLEENGFVHGKIRSRSVFVFDRSQGPLKVKLGEPGVLQYTDEDVPWIAPEHLQDMDSVASAPAADVYALGTTLWEIFNRASSPFGIVPLDQATEFFKSGNCLPLAEVPQEFHPIIAGCWLRDPDDRNAPDEMVRNIDRILHQIDEPRDGEKLGGTGGLQPARGSKIETTQLPALRQVVRESKLSRKNSTGSESSIASRKDWKSNKLLKFLLRTRGTEYDTLSNISSIAPSRHTFDTDLHDDDQPNGDSQDERSVEDDDKVDYEKWEVMRKDVKLHELIGKGYFGQVYRAVLTRADGSEEIVAAKRMNSSVEAYSHKDVQNEMDIMIRLSHPNIVEILGVIREDETLLVMEFMGLGALSAYLQANERILTNKVLAKFACDVASAMAYLERKKIIHRDLAARNILVKSETCVKLSDFGLARILDKDYYDVCTPNRALPIKWYAPESIFYNRFTIKSDIWSFGVALWEIFTCGQDPAILDSNEPTKIGDALVDGVRLPPPERCPVEVYQMMRECWNLEQNLRPNFADLHFRIFGIIDDID
ncbi:uncharacterized protein LOC100908044 [Galendromus occidentalis]|uniref:Uncharacterized protein LOC100908044 n=1 Tax=Galendromus occidentalis TaxID=34638 RepID=A0AAJ7SI67_9ACAR|nr:uncharacterized protein LOC100908044 [Galendromus occidentalis]